MIFIASLQVDNLIQYLIYLASNSWEQVTPSSGSPPARGKHDAVSVKNEVFIFGGKGDSVYGDLWGFNAGKYI